MSLYDNLTEAFQSTEKDGKPNSYFKLTQPWEQALTEITEKKKLLANLP